mmetsp:Transcript_4972/g.9948  ORF Transcript_4972/g.9948 Transcript_4972/m.9948 type:complete len:230 (-) Transcript_4972:366-1055(-)
MFGLRSVAGFLFAGSLSVLAQEFEPSLSHTATFAEQGVNGTFNLTISEGSMSYSFRLLVDQAAFSSCDLKEEGLTYHIHSVWLHEDKLSGTFEECGAPKTAGHWDPTFACGSSSSQLKMADGSVNPECISYNKETANTPASVAAEYTCGFGGVCEVGDLSGKQGILYANGDEGVFEGSYTDALPEGVSVQTASEEFLADLQVPDQPAWASMVFHCAPTNARLFCAFFSH